MSAVIDDSVGFEEPTAETAPTADRNAVVIAQDLTRVQSALGEFDRVSSGLAELEARFPKDVVYDVTTPKGMKDAIEHRAAYREPRVLVEKARKMAKAPILALGKNVDARAAWITERLEAGETPVHEQIKAEEARKAQEKADREAKEFGRVLAIQEALAGISQDVMIACGKASADIGTLLYHMLNTKPDPLVFQEMVDAARAAWDAGITKLETAYKAKLWDEEQEAARVAAEIERKRQREAEDAERARVAAAQEVEAQRLEAAAAEAKRQAEVQTKLSNLTKHVTDCFGKPAAFVQNRIDLLSATVYSESLGAEVLTAHDAALTQLRTLHSMAVQQEAQAAQIASQQAEESARLAAEALKAEQETAPVSQPTNTAIPEGIAEATCRPDEAKETTQRGAVVLGSGEDAKHEVGSAIPKGPLPAETLPPNKLGDINARIAPFQISADGLAQLGFTPVATEKAAKLYRASDFPLICNAAVKHFVALALGEAS